MVQKARQLSNVGSDKTTLRMGMMYHERVVLTVPVDLVFSVEMGSRCGCSTYAPLPQGITLS